jgi:redox-sensitive bicupin YhaK (pirin superfamily)
MAYFFLGKNLAIGERSLSSSQVAELRGDAVVPLENGDEEAEILLLQARPIGEPVSRSGPFVMNTKEEIQKAYLDYRATQFGGWPWPKNDPVHDREARFARHADGHFEKGA